MSDITPPTIPDWAEDKTVYKKAIELRNSGVLLKSEFEAYENFDKTQVITADGLKAGNDLKAKVDLATTAEASAEHDRLSTLRGQRYTATGATVGGIAGGVVGAVGGAPVADGGGSTIFGGIVAGTFLGGIAGKGTSVLVGVSDSVTGKEDRDIAILKEDYTNDTNSALRKITAALDTNEVQPPASTGQQSSPRAKE